MSKTRTDIPIETHPLSPPELVTSEQSMSVETYTQKFLKSLDAKGIRYCHWKSNIRLSDTLAGREDIDVLVDRREAVEVFAVMGKHGFKLAQSRFGTDHPGVFHALGLDERLGEIVDLHAHYWVLSGDSFVKNYRFPVADALLDGRHSLLCVSVPQPEEEYVLFVLRIALKSLAPVEILKANIRYEKIVKEMDWLQARADRDAAAALCATWFPSVSESLFREAENAVATEKALVRRFFVGTSIAWRLRHIRRLGPLSGFFSRVGRLTAYTLARVRKRRDLVPCSGGLIIALVGPKAAGKSTLSNALAQRLGKHLDVVRIHVGKPPATLITALPRILVPLARRILPHERLREYEKPERRKEKRYSLIYVLRMTLIAYERRRLLLRAQRLATSGTIVISDRYPSGQTGAIDGSCFDDETLSRAGSVLKRGLMKSERWLYRDLPKPDLVLQLQAPLELAVKRDQQRQKQGGPDAESVRRRWWLENDVNFTGVPVVPIDTARPLEDTTVEAIRAVWGAI